MLIDSDNRFVLSNTAMLRTLLLLLVILLLTSCGPSRPTTQFHPIARSNVFNSAPIEEPVAYSSIQHTGTVPVKPNTDLSLATSTYVERPRYALVIGNSAYSRLPLENPRHDAQDIAAALQRVNFKVKLLLDAGQQGMEQAIKAFGETLSANAVGLFYYAGHAVQYGGENYLIPTDTIEHLTVADHLRYKTVNAGYILGIMEEAGNGLNIVVLDACRDNPFPSFSRNISTRGLARIASPTGSLIVYATSPGNTAQDGTGRNSPFTLNWLRYIEEPNITIDSMMKRVIAGVKKATKGQQVPWYSSSIDRDFYFIE